MQSTPERRPCGTCGKECSVNADGTVRHHLTDNPGWQAGPDSRKCKGAGQPPATAAGVALAEDMETGQPQCRLCRHPVELTGNGRVRSHLTPEATPRPCPAGSDFPLGTYPDMVGTTDGLVASLAVDCGHVPAGQCYGCHGAAGGPVSDAELNAMEEAQGTGVAPWGVDAAAVQQPTMADQFKSAAPTTLVAELERETSGTGTVLDAMGDSTRSEAERFMNAAVPAQPAARAEHVHIDSTGVEWRHPGLKGDCQASDCAVPAHSEPEGFDPRCARCNEDSHRCPGCGTSVPHGVVACAECTARVDAEKAARQAACTHPDGFRDTISVHGREVPACEHCDAVGWFTPPASKLPQGETGDGRPCDHADGVFGVENDRLVCVACGMPCTHPDGFKGTADDVDQDGQDRVVSTCGLCGAMDPEDELPDDDSQGTQCTHPDGYRPTGPDGGDLTEAAALDTSRVCPHCGASEPVGPDPVDEWRTPDDLVAEMPEDVRGLDALRLNCGTCGHPVTPRVGHFDLYGKPASVEWGCREGFHSGYRLCRDHECTPDTRVRLGELDEGDYFIRGGTLMRLTERESSTSVLAVVVGGPYDGRTGELKNLNETVEWAPEPRTDESEKHVVTDDSDGPEHVDDCPGCPDDEPKTGPVRVGDLEHGDVFIRRGTAMRVTSAGYGLVEAVVVDNGPHAGRTGELKNPDEVVERIATGPQEQETKECPDDRTATRQPRSSSAPTTTSPTTAPAPGSQRPSPASAPAVSPKSGSVTSSAPTARTAGNGRSAAVTTDQSAAAAAFLGGGRPAAPVTVNQPQDQAAAAAQFLAGGSGTHGEKETKRDRYGRYLIPHPDTGKEKAWTRATTFAKSISDTYALSQWGLRMALLGATMRPDLVARAHGKHVRVDKKLLDELTADLKNAAGDKVAANHGTNVHSFTEMADRAWHSPGGPRSILDQVPPDYRDMVETYIRLLEETGLEPVPHLIEFTTVVKQYGVAGTSDNCYKVTRPLVLKIGRAEVRLEPGEYVIGDKKTGRDLDYGWQEIVIQLAVYAQGINTAGVWDRADEVWEPDPLSRFDAPGTKVRLDAGIVIHLPVDEESEKTPTVYGVDLESGWNAAVLCERVRAWRNVRTLASPAMVSGEPLRAASTPQQPAAVVSRTTVRPPTLKDKARAVTSKGDASAVWTEATKAGLSKAEVDELVDIMQARLRELTEPGG